MMDDLPAERVTRGQIGRDNRAAFGKLRRE
jgi:hypothetical protein